MLNLYHHSLSTPYYATRGSFGPGNIKKKPRLITGYTSPLDPWRDLTTQKVRVANENHEKSNIAISWLLFACNGRKMVCWGIERVFIIHMTIIKQSETFLKRFESIGPTSGGNQMINSKQITHLQPPHPFDYVEEICITSWRKILTFTSKFTLSFLF